MSYSMLVRYGAVAQKILLDVNECKLSRIDGSSEMNQVLGSCMEHEDEFLGGEAMLFGAFIGQAQGLVQDWLNEHVDKFQVEYQDDLAKFMMKSTDLADVVGDIAREILTAMVRRGFLLDKYAIVHADVRAIATNRVCVTFRAEDGTVPFSNYLHRDGSDKWRPLPGRTVELDFTNQYINFLFDHKVPHACRYMDAEALKVTEEG